MTLETVQRWLTDYHWLFLIVALILGYFLDRLTRWALAPVLYRIAIRTESVYDDLVVDRLHPFRVAWLLPLGLIYALFYTTIGPDPITTNIVLFLIVLVVVDLSIAQLNGFNKVYQARPTYNGANIAAYIDIIKVLIFVGTIFLTLVIFTDSSPVALLAGLVLIFRDTILNFLASIQLSTQELIKDGDWTEVPSLGVEGVVSDVTLSVIKVRNFDNTISAVPIYKLVEVPYKNYRGMEAWGRRIKRAVHIGLNSVRFCDEEMAVARS